MHFPIEADMVKACTSPWIELHRPPNVSRWTAIANHDERLGIEHVATWFPVLDRAAHWRRAPEAIVRSPSVCVDE